MEWACSARAEVAVSAFRTALWCSLRRCVKVLPVCPMYVLGQFVQGMRYIYYTWPFVLGDLVLRVY